MFGQQQGNGTNNTNSGIQICVEPLYEWQIQEIGYDGFEKYKKPPEFKDILRKNAKRVDWRKIIGNDTSLDTGIYENTSESDEALQKDDNKYEKALSPALDEHRATTSTANAYKPVAGPWAVVSKQLHNSLQEISILLDALRISTNASYYLNPVVNALVQYDRSDSEQTEQINSKSFQVCTRKKVFAETTNVIDSMMGNRQLLTAMENNDDGNFTKELRELRENWRIRKVGQNIYGDLGYKTYAPKFAPHECFDIMQKTIVDRREATIRHENSSYIAVRLPHNLRYRTKLLVFIQPDNEASAQLLYKSEYDDSCRRKSYLTISNDEIKHMHWRNLLSVAQETLISKDILVQLDNESVAQQDMISMSTENCIVISMFDNLLLRVHLHFYPIIVSTANNISFYIRRLIPLEEANTIPDMEVSSKEWGAIPYLNQCLRELFMAEHTNKQKRNQQFVTLHQTLLPENLDMRGPQAFSSEEILARMKPIEPLIKRFFDCTAHYVLLTRTIDFLEDYMIRFGDPYINWKLTYASQNKFTLILVTFVNRGFENMGKFSCQIRVNDISVTMLTKDLQQISCRRDMALLADSLLLYTANFLMNTLNQMARIYNWQILHSNLNAIDMGGDPAPTFYACNQTATKYLFIQFHKDGQTPDIFMKIAPISAVKGTQPETTKINTELGGYCKLDYARIPGSTFIRKTENLLITFIS